MRDSHYKYGDFNNKNFYATTNNLTYQKIDKFEKVQLNEDKKADLRDHHFTLG